MGGRGEGRWVVVCGELEGINAGGKMRAELWKGVGMAVLWCGRMGTLCGRSTVLENNALYKVHHMSSAFGACIMRRTLGLKSSEMKFFEYIVRTTSTRTFSLFSAGIDCARRRCSRM